MPNTSRRYPPNNVIKKLYDIGLGAIIGRLILLLITTGRKTGLPRTTPLQYEQVDGDFYLGSALGQKADWFKNILANPRVDVRVKSRRFHGLAESITDPVQIANFLELRLKRHPIIIGAILRSEGLPRCPDRSQLEAYASQLAMVVIHPR